MCKTYTRTYYYYLLTINFNNYYYNNIIIIINIFHYFIHCLIPVFEFCKHISEYILANVSVRSLTAVMR